MVVLTEEMVVARTKQSNIAGITKLNCWGSQLTDVSIIRRMTNVVVLSLSINCINTLADFQFCKCLQDLFIRKNNIENLNEVFYLQKLENLRNLWLDENPCSKVEGYRLAVIRALPKLQKLDNDEVQNTEVQAALRSGRILTHPDSQEYYSDPDDEEFDQAYVNEPQDNEYTDLYTQEPNNEQYQRDAPSHASYETQHNNYNEISHQYNQDFNKTEPEMYAPVKIEQRQQLPRSRTQPNVQADGDGLYSANEWRKRSCQSTCCIQSNNQRRPNERRTNVLNAVLCLIKELDYPNLEVVQMAVKCRMEEMLDET